MVAHHRARFEWSRIANCSQLLHRESIDGRGTGGVGRHCSFMVVRASDVLEPLVGVGARLELGYADARAVELTHSDWSVPSSPVYGIMSVVHTIGNGSPSRPSAGMIFGRSSTNNLCFRSAYLGSSGP